MCFGMADFDLISCSSMRIVLLVHAWLPISITNVQHQATCPEQIFSIEEHHLQ